jgi:hypothetical protein
MDPILKADVLVTVHLTFVLFVLVGQILIVAGGLLHWSWVRNFWFRLVHLLSILVVAGQAVFGIECPLTTWERELRGGYLFDLEGASAIGRFCNETLYFRPNPPVFMAIYVSFALLVVLTWIFTPPRLPWRKADQLASVEQ